MREKSKKREWNAQCSMRNQETQNLSGLSLRGAKRRGNPCVSMRHTLPNFARKAPLRTAKAALSCPFGAIHLEGSWHGAAVTEGLQLHRSVVVNYELRLQSLRQNLWFCHLPLHKGGFGTNRNMTQILSLLRTDCHGSERFLAMTETGDIADNAARRKFDGISCRGRHMLYREGMG